MKGNIALTTVLVFSALFIATAIIIIYQALDFANSTTSYTNQIYAQNMSFSCLEEALYKISRDPSYGVGNETFTIVLEENGGQPVKSCSADVGAAGSLNESRVIAVKSNYRNASYDITRTIIDINAENWQVN